MQRIHRHPAVLLLTLTLGLLLPAPSGASEHMRFYKTGLNAAQAQNWEQVDTLMRRAIAVRSEEKRRGVLRRGGYFPHYYLGLARYYLGDCPGALEAWAESEGQGVIVGRDEYAELLRLQGDCQAHGAPTIRSGSPESTAISGKSGKTGKGKVRTVQRWVEKGKEPARRTLGALAEATSEDSELGKFARKGQKVVDVLETGTDLVDLALPPDKKLEMAINAYFAGNPQRTLAFLEAINMRDPRARAQVYLFQAAANFRLHLLRGGDETLLAAARKAGDLFQREQWRSDFRADFFDPRFVRFLRGGN